MSDEVEVEVLPEIIPNLIQSAPVAQVLDAQKAYHELCEALLDDSDYQTIGDRRFRKKSGWRKLAVAFNVSTELLKEDVERGPRGQILRVQCTVRATAPNGRFQDGIGACDLFERCCEPGSCKLKEFWPDSGKPTGHVHCGDNCKGKHHFSNPSHDIPSTAMTRATNRPQADLFGMGEVSAEEITDRGEYAEPTRGPQTASEPAKNPRGAHQSQIDRIEALIAHTDTYKDWDECMMGIIGQARGRAEISFGEARNVISTLQGPPR
jgi:hypothetical protein